MVASAGSLAALPDGGRFVALDSWRGIAALGVTAYHISAGGPLFETAPVTRMNQLVDFFFVLSGFVLSAAYGQRLAQGFPIGRYMLLRLGRVYPLHLLLVLAYVVLELAVLWLQPGNLIPREPFTGDRDPWVLLASLALVGPWFSPPVVMYNAPSWSIAVEVWLYLAFALTLRFGGRAGWWLLPALALVALPVSALGAWPDAVPQLMVRGVIGFGLGVAVWRIREASPKRLASPSTRAASLAELAAVAALAALLTVPEDTAPWKAVTIIAFAVTVLTFAADRGIVSRLLHRRPFVWLGVLSYSLYMVHGMVLGRSLDLLRFAGLGTFVELDGEMVRAIAAGPWQSSALGCLMIAACLPVAWLTWRFVEAPARDWSRRRAARWGIDEAERVAPTL